MTDFEKIYALLQKGEFHTEIDYFPDNENTINFWDSEGMYSLALCFKNGKFVGFHYND